MCIEGNGGRWIPCFKWVDMPGWGQVRIINNPENIASSKVLCMTTDVGLFIPFQWN
jgi:hypothetical protein